MDARPGLGQCSLWTAVRMRVVWVSGLRADDRRTVSIEKLSLSLFLSSCRKPKLKEGNKSFVPEPRESSVFRVYRIPMHMNILCMWKFFRIMVILHLESVYFCYQLDIAKYFFLCFLRWETLHRWWNPNHLSRNVFLSINLLRSICIILCQLLFIISITNLNPTVTNIYFLAKLTAAVEYTDCTSEEEYEPPLQRVS